MRTGTPPSRSTRAFSASIHWRIRGRARTAAGTAFVLVEQNLGFVEAVASRYLVLDQGRAVVAAERGAVTRDTLVAHLGV